jgi:hypothetical protein
MRANPLVLRCKLPRTDYHLIDKQINSSQASTCLILLQQLSGEAARTRKLHPIGKPNLIDIFLTKA